MANEYLKRQPTSSGNSRRWTVSFWMKNSDPTQGYTAIIGAGKVSPTNVYNEIFYNGSQTGLNLDKSSDPDNYNITANPLLRDPSAWMHVVVSFTDQGDNANTRIKFYINGAFVDHNTGTALDVSETSFFNDSEYIHYIGSRAQQSYGTTTFDAQYFDVFLVDGQALTPDVFGFYKEGKGYQSSGSSNSTDFGPGQWSPHSPRKIKTEIERKGGFGVNGFYLPMNDSSNVGADFHTTPNSIITLKGEDLPQPRNGAPTTSDAYVSQLRSDPYAANLVLAVPGVELENTNPELVTNGDFSNGTTGWNGLSGGSLSVEDGKLKITETTGALDAYAVNSTAITTEVGKRYTIKWTFHEGTNTTFTVRFGNSGNQSQEYQSNTGANGYGSYPDPGTYSFTFTATATTLNLSFIVNQASSYGYVSNVSVKEAVAVRDYSADIKGSGTNKTVTGVGLAGVYPVPSYYGSAMRFGNDGTNGAGNTDMINVPTSSDFVFNGDVTIECWLYVKSAPTTAGAFLGQWQSNGGTNRNIMMYLDTSNQVTSYVNSGGSNYNTGASPALALNQWHHIATEKDGDKFRLYVNGVCVGIRATTPTAGNTAAVPFTIGAETESGGTITGADYGIDGYIQDVRVYKGVAKYKGGFDVPKPYSPIGIESWRQVSDTCKNNFCTMNPLNHNNGTFANGNLTTSEPAANGAQIYATMGSNTGKWYYEAHIEDVGTPNTGGTLIGINPLIRPSSNIQNRTAYRSEGSMYNDSGTSSGSSTYAYVAGDTIGVAWDADNKRLWFAKNGTWLGSGDPAGNSNPNVNYTNTETQGPFIAYDNGTGAQVTHLNFGQNPTFSGSITAGTYTDGNGKGLFKYQPPSGYLALCEDNLPTPAIADPGDYFKTVLYTGTGSSRAVTGVGFKPDFVWIKNRDSTYQHQVYDSVRGAAQKLLPSTTNVEVTDTANLSSFDSNGFSFAGGNVGVNQDTKNHVAWCWKAGGAAVSNTTGDINSVISLNQDAGFSIVSYNGSGNVSDTVGHGLGKTPSFILLKCRTQPYYWRVYHSVYGTSPTQGLLLGDAPTSQTGSYNHDAHGGVGSVSTSTFGFGTDGTNTLTGVNKSGETYIAYCWAEIEGFSKFGSYTGNGSTDGPFVYCGFKPAWVMVKSSSNGSTNWRIWDSSRGPTNPTNLDLLANTSDIENQHAADEIDLLSNGFKIRSTGSWHNLNGASFIFTAFAESPFQTANAK